MFDVFTAVVCARLDPATSTKADEVTTTTVITVDTVTNRYFILAPPFTGFHPLSNHVWSLKLFASTTSVSPSQWPRECPIQASTG